MTDFVCNRSAIHHRGRTEHVRACLHPAGDRVRRAGLSPAITRAAEAALPAGWHFGLTGSALLANGKPSSAGPG